MKKNIFNIILVILIILLILLIILRYFFNKPISNIANDGENTISNLKIGDRWYSYKKTLFNSNNDIRDDDNQYNSYYLYIDNDNLNICNNSSDECLSYAYKMNNDIISFYDKDNKLINSVDVYIIDDVLYFTEYNDNDSFSITLFKRGID